MFTSEFWLELPAFFEIMRHLNGTSIMRVLLYKGKGFDFILGWVVLI